eukprot:5015670-Amphidinium_carterae.1
MAKEERKDINNNSSNSKATAMCVASGVMQQQLAGTTTTPEFNAAICSNHINNNKLEQHQYLQLLDILKCSA